MTKLSQAIIKIEQLARTQALGSSTTDDIIRIIKELNNNSLNALKKEYRQADKEYAVYYKNRYGSLEGYGEFNNETYGENTAWEQGYLYGLNQAIQLLNK